MNVIAPARAAIAWLDARSPLRESDQLQLAQWGLYAHSIANLDDLRALAGKIQLIAIRVDGNTDALDECLARSEWLGRRIPVICRVDSGNLTLAVDAMRRGAAHVLSVDAWDQADWEPVIGLLEQTTTAPRPRSVVFVDPASRQLLSLAQRVAQAEVTALLTGPTGAGKEVLARVLHEASPRSSGPFVSLNCGAMPENLIEDMLFGHERGAFSGAIRDHKGIFEQADGGTVFLDEIGEMPMNLQTRLLRVLQERCVTRLGGSRSISVNVRVVAATNKDLKQAIAQREFREDLYYRISTFALRVPPLRDRREDIVPMAMHFLSQHGRGGQGFRLSSQACNRLLAHSWPGNVRELENVVQRAIVICPHEVIGVEHLMFDEEGGIPVLTSLPSMHGGGTDVTLPNEYANADASEKEEAAFSQLTSQGSVGSKDDEPCTMTEPYWTGKSSGSDLHAAVRSSELQIIQEAIRKTASREAAARLLGISPRTLRYKLAQMRNLGLIAAEAA